MSQGKVGEVDLSTFGFTGPFFVDSPKGWDYAFERQFAIPRELV